MKTNRIYIVDGKIFKSVKLFASYISHLYNVPIRITKQRIHNGKTEEECKKPHQENKSKAQSRLFKKRIDDFGYTLKIGQGRNYNDIRVFTVHPLFKNDIICNIDYESITFKMASLNDRKSITPYMGGKRYSAKFDVNKRGFDIPFGKYKIEEDSSAEIIKIYFSDVISN